MAQLNDTMVQGDLRVTGTVFGTTANIPDIYTNDKIAYGDATGQSLLIASRAYGGLTNMNVTEAEAISLNGFVTPLTKYSKVSSDSYKCEFDSIIGGNDGTTDYPMWHHVTYAGTNSWTSSLTRLLTTTSSISSTDDLEPLLTASRGVVKSNSAGAFPSAATGTSPSGNILGFNCASWASLGANQYGIVFHGDGTSSGLTYNNSYILANNAAFTGVSDIGYDSTAHYFQGMSQSARKAKYAEYALSGGTLDNALNDKMKKDASNAVAPSGSGTGATATLLNNLTSTGLSDITSGDVCIPTTNSDGTNTNKWYKRPLSYLWPWIKAKITSNYGRAAFNSVTSAYGLLATIDTTSMGGNCDIHATFKIKCIKDTSSNYTGYRTLTIDVRTDNSSPRNYTYYALYENYGEISHSFGIKLYRTNNDDLRIYAYGGENNFYGSVFCHLESCTNWNGESECSRVSFNSGSVSTTVPSGTAVTVGGSTEQYIECSLSSNKAAFLDVTDSKVGVYTYAGASYHQWLCYTDSSGNNIFNGNANSATYGRSISLDDESVSLLDKVKELGKNNQHYARFFTYTDGGAGAITNRPVTSAEGFVCEAMLTRRTSKDDYRIQLIYWRRGITEPYYAHITQASTSISWTKAITSSDGYGGNIAMGSGNGNTLGKALNGKVDGLVDGVPTSLKLIIADSVGSEDNAIYLT